MDGGDTVTESDLVNIQYENLPYPPFGENEINEEEERLMIKSFDIPRDLDVKVERSGAIIKQITYTPLGKLLVDGEPAFFKIKNKKDTLSRVIVIHGFTGSLSFFKKQEQLSLSTNNWSFCELFLSPAASEKPHTYVTNEKLRNLLPDGHIFSKNKMA